MVGAVTEQDAELRTHGAISQGPGKTCSCLTKPRAHLQVLKVGHTISAVSQKPLLPFSPLEEPKRQVCGVNQFMGGGVGCRDLLLSSPQPQVESNYCFRSFTSSMWELKVGPSAVCLRFPTCGETNVHLHLGCFKDLF